MAGGDKSAGGGRIKGTTLKFDPEFRFLLALDPAFEEWRSLATEWWSLEKRGQHTRIGITAFFVTYLHGQGLDKSPRRLLDASVVVPKLWDTLRLDSKVETYAQQSHDAVSDLIDWALREKFAEPDGSIPDKWRNPFPRKGAKQHGKQGDLTFRHVLMIDPRMAAWVAYAAEYIETVRVNQGVRSYAVGGVPVPIHYSGRIVARSTGISKTNDRQTGIH